MILRQILRSLKNPSAILISSKPIQFSCPTPISHRPFSLSAYFKPQEDAEPITPENVAGESKNSRKPLHIYFKEAVGLLKRTIPDVETESEGENGELKKRLRKLEEELRSLKEKRKADEKENLKTTVKQKKKEGIKKNDGLLRNEAKSGGSSLSLLFGKKDASNGEERLKEMENPEVYKELSPDMEMFVNHLYKNGYFKDSNFLPRNRFDITCFENSYARDFIKYAAEQFGKDNQEVAK